MATITYDEPITKNTDWGGDSTTGGRPVAGGRVQDFIKGSLQDLDDRIKNISGLGRFLSGWDCTTGLAVTNPSGSTYEYPDGAFYIVAKVGAKNYRPSGSKYVVGTASNVVETGSVKVGDVYKYDGSAWLLINLDTQEIPAFSNETAGTIRGKAQDGFVSAEDGYGKVQGISADGGVFDIDGGLKVNGKLHVAGSGTQGHIDFGDIEGSTGKGYVYIGEDDDDELTIHASGRVNIDSDDVTINDKNVATEEYVKESFASLNDELYSYGVFKDFSNSSPDCVRIGNMGLHRTLPIHSQIKGCLLDDNGNRMGWFNEKTWTGETRDGSLGQVMVRIPRHYRKFNYPNGNLEVRLSELPLPGYHEVPEMYISAYEAALDRNNLMLASVVNDTARYRGGNNNASLDGTPDSLLGRPVSNINLTDFRTYARKRKAGSSQWNCYTYEAHKALFWLFVVEYATLNSQADYTPELTAEGYRQGGLGCMDMDYELNDYNPIIPCGYTDFLGNGTGIAEYEFPENYGTAIVSRYRGIENPFGHIWKWTDGILIKNAEVFTSNLPNDFSSVSVDNYNLVGNAKSGSGYIKKIIGGEYGEMIATETGGSSNTYFCDYHFYSKVSALRGVLFGGYAASGAIAGFACAYAGGAPSGADASVGSRLCFHP